MKRDHLRKVKVTLPRPGYTDHTFEAYFHEFKMSGRTSQVYAILEREDGYVSVLQIENIQFIS